MGCDIHLYIEKKKTSNGTEEWISCDRFKFNEYYDPEDDDGETEFNHCPIYRGRNYGLFATLADVRNDYGIDPISEPKGLPKNIHKVTKKEADYWDSDGHSHSWLTIKELTEYQLNSPGRKESGYISPQAAVS